MNSPPPIEPRPEPHPERICFAQTLVLLLIGLAPVPAGWAWAHSLLDSVCSTELNRAERENSATGYYEGLIGQGDPEGSGNELAMRMLRKPSDWARFHAADVTRALPDRDYLQFELKPEINKVVFGHPFTTNAHGMRDRDYAVHKPEGVFRIAVLGSSMDMGWGIACDETYVNRLEDWLNEQASQRGLSRRFEVLNFAVAAYSPLQRVEAFRRKALRFQPDLVLYSATMLDTRLLEIHLCDLFRARAELPHDYLRRALADAGITPDDLAIAGAEDKLLHKESVKRKLRPQYWSIQGSTLGDLAAICRSEGIELACLIIPRVGKADAPGARAESVARLEGIARIHAIPLFDLSATFDGQDPALFEIAPWDDHPNALGHQRLFQGLARALEADPDIGAKLLADPGP